MIHLVRHGESRWNRFNDISPDVALTDIGQLQARNVVLNVDLVVCSPMRRARETLEHSKISYKKIICSENAREHKNGLGCNYLHNEKNEQEDFISRMEIFRKELDILKDNHKSIVVVTHHGVIKALTGIDTYNCQVVRYI